MVTRRMDDRICHQRLTLNHQRKAYQIICSHAEFTMTPQTTFCGHFPFDSVIRETFFCNTNPLWGKSVDHHYKLQNMIKWKRNLKFAEYSLLNHADDYSRWLFTNQNGNAVALFVRHYGNVIMTTMASQITSLTIVYSTVIQTQIKENIKAPRHWPLCGEFTGDRWIPRTNDQLRGKCFHLMTSSCIGHWATIKKMSARHAKKNSTRSITTNVD